MQDRAFAFRRPMSTLAFLLNQSVNALSQAALLFFLGVGLTLIFGIMRIVNFAHGALYMLGAFVGYSLVRYTGSFWVALVAGTGRRRRWSAPRSSSCILRRLYRRDAHAFLMVTFGLALVVTRGGTADLGTRRAAGAAAEAAVRRRLPAR